MDNASVRFSELSIQGFRRLSDVRLSLRPLSVMIGANGTGKTSVLDVLSLLASSAQGKLSSSLSELWGLESALTHDRAERREIGITKEVPDGKPLVYTLWLRPHGIAHAISEELHQKKPEPPPFQY